MVIKKLFFVFFLPIILFGIVTISASAQQAEINLTASPTSIDVVSPPGTTLSEKVRIRNNADSPIQLKIELKKLVADSTGQISVRDFQKGDDYQQWISIENATLSARPKEWTDIPFTITIPQTAAFSYYWALMVSVESPKSQINTPQAKITGSVAVPILLAIRKNGIIFSGRVDSFATDKGFYEYLPTNFLLTFQNSGNVHVKPRGNIFITDWTGKQIDSIGINEAQGNVLPGSKRTFTSTWDNGFITNEEKIEDGKVVTDSRGNPQTELKIHFDRLLAFRIGKYTATALVVVSGDKRDYSFEQTTSFFVFPWKIVLGTVIFVLLAGIGLANTIKSLFRWIKKMLKKKE